MGTPAAADAKSLLRSAIDGEPGSLEALFLRYHQPLLSRIVGRIPASLGASSSAEDVLQDAFVEAFRSFPRFVPPAREDESVPAFFGWLTMITDRALASACRRANSAKRGGGAQAAVPGPFAQSSVALVIDMLAQDSSTPSRVAREGEAEMAVLAALEKLGEDQRRALELRYFQGLPPAQIAAHMGRTEHAIHNLCARALEVMRREMGDVNLLFSRP